jgi:biopolymer transport protein ExbB
MMLAQVSLPGFLKESVGLFDVIQKGGLLMWPILGCSIVGLAVFTERMLYFRRNRMAVGEFLTGILNLLRRRHYLEALERCEEGQGPIKRVVQTAILKRNLPPLELREVVKEVAQLRVPRLEANLSLLATVGYISPLLGLLGTVIGMIEAFIQISRSSGTAPVGDLAGGIWTALITTAAGLVVAIPCYVAYNYLVTVVQSMVADMERAGIEVIHVLTEPSAQDVIVRMEADPDAKHGGPTSKSA